jgi:Linalool dehydratase/isomerase
MNTQAIRTSFLDTLPSGTKGPVTKGRHRRNALVYGLLCVAALLPTLLHWSPGLQTVGLGLFAPGTGFLALGSWMALLFPLTLGLFWLSIVAWFWTGMVIAPLTVWFGSALLAGALVGEQVWPPAIFLAPAAAAAVFLVFQYRGMKRRAKDREMFAFRQTYFAESLAEVRAKVVSEPVAGQRELTPDQISAVRYVLDRALQPVDQFKGFTIIDQFQPAALRYQINHMGFALGMAQGMYTPNFHGYLSQAQRNLIDKYRVPRVWNYWVKESMWGHFNFTHHDPVVRDNIMLSGWYGMHVGQYTLNSGDKRYADPQSLTFKLNDRKVYSHDFHTVIHAVAKNFEKNPFCLFPCEPNWVYPICNMYGMSSLAVHDATFGTTYARTALPQWLTMLENEFTDQKGSIVGLRSKWTGLEMPFYTGEAGFAFFANVFSPPLARRLWAVGRKELGMCLTPGSDGLPRLTFPMDQMPFLDKIDPGHYKPGVLFAYVAVLMCAREFGDDELAEAAIRSMDQDCGRMVQNGVLSFKKGSCLANVWAVEGRIMGTGDFRNSFTKGPPASALAGPMLEDVKYPDVLVAKAFSTGADLELVLYPGAAEGVQELGIGRLRPNQSYKVSGARVDQLMAGADGNARLQVPLSGRTRVFIEPNSMH